MLSSEAALQNLPAGKLFFACEINAAAARALPEYAQWPLAARVMQPCAGLVHEVVAGGAVSLPFGQHFLFAAQNFLHDEIRGSFGAIRRPLAFQGAKPLTQFSAVLTRSRKSIHMIDPQPVDHAFGIEPKNR